MTMRNNLTLPLFLFALFFISLQVSAQTAAFTDSINPVTGCSPVTVHFYDQSTGAVTTWAWTFGDGNTSTLQNPTNTYSNPGTYTVTLIVNGGSSVSHQIIVHGY